MRMEFNKKVQFSEMNNISPRRICNSDCWGGCVGCCYGSCNTGCHGGCYSTCYGTSMRKA